MLWKVHGYTSFRNSLIQHPVDVTWQHLSVPFGSWAPFSVSLSPQVWKSLPEPRFSGLTSNKEKCEPLNQHPLPDPVAPSWVLLDSVLIREQQPRPQGMQSTGSVRPEKQGLLLSQGWSRVHITGAVSGKGGHWETSTEKAWRAPEWPDSRSPLKWSKICHLKRCHLVVRTMLSGRQALFHLFFILFLFEGGFLGEGDCFCVLFCFDILKVVLMKQIPKQLSGLHLFPKSRTYIYNVVFSSLF